MPRIIPDRIEPRMRAQQKQTGRPFFDGDIQEEVFRKLAVTGGFRGRGARETLSWKGRARPLMTLLEKLSPRSDGPQRFSRPLRFSSSEFIVPVLFWRISFTGETMPRSLWDAPARQELVNRLDRLAPEAKPLWGKMTAPQMLAHLADWMLMAKGELKTAPKKKALRFPPLKQLVIYWLPSPKGVPTAPELIGRKPLDHHLRQFGV